MRIAHGRDDRRQVIDFDVVLAPEVGAPPPVDVASGASPAPKRGLLDWLLRKPLVMDDPTTEPDPAPQVNLEAAPKVPVVRRVPDGMALARSPRNYRTR